MILKLQQHIYNCIKTALQTVSTKALEDVYAFSFFIHESNFYPELSFGYNTNSNLALENDGDINSNSEPKWNYAFWLQNEVAFFGEEEDPSYMQLIKQWAIGQQLHLEYDILNMDEAHHNAYSRNAKEVKHAIIRVLSMVISEVQKTQQLQVPILLMDLDLEPYILTYNEKANGILADDFLTYWKEILAWRIS